MPLWGPRGFGVVLPDRAGPVRPAWWRSRLDDRRKLALGRIELLVQLVALMV